LKRVRGTHPFKQRLTLRLPKNATALSGPLWLVLDGLPPEVINGQPQGVILTNQLGVTQFRAPLGSPFVLLLGGQLQPGKKLTLDLVFADPLELPITYTPRVLAGSALLL
jgi:hypothetical protein